MSLHEMIRELHTLIWNFYSYIHFYFIIIIIILFSIIIIIIVNLSF